MKANKYLVALLFLIAATATTAQAADKANKHRSTPEDIKAITQVTKDFQAAVASKNIKRLSSLMFATDIPFVSPSDDGFIKQMRETTDVNFDGIRGSGYVSFAMFVAQSTKPIEENFSNMKITQDGHLAWVIFDYEMRSDGKVLNYGVESWQMIKTNGQWKIYSVAWSTNRPGS